MGCFEAILFFGNFCRVCTGCFTDFPTSFNTFIEDFFLSHAVCAALAKQPMQSAKLPFQKTVFFLLRDRKCIVPRQLEIEEYDSGSSRY